jgi:DNA repair protein RadC
VLAICESTPATGGMVLEKEREDRAMIVKENTKQKVNSAFEVSRVLSAILDMDSEIDRDKEHFWIIGLNTKNAIKFIDMVSLGTLTASIVHPREVFRLAVNRGVASIIAGHNHPSGDPAPSRDDIAVTERLKKAGEILGIAVLDHVIIGSDGQFTSLKEQGIL